MWACKANCSTELYPSPWPWICICLSHCFLFLSFGYMLRSGINGLYGNSMFTFWGIATLSSNGCIVSHSHKFQFLHMLANTCYFLFLLHLLSPSCFPSFSPALSPLLSLLSFLPFLFFSVIAILVGMKFYLIVVLVCISLVTSDVEHLWCTYWPFVYFLWRKVYSNPLPIL